MWIVYIFTLATMDFVAGTSDEPCQLPSQLWSPDGAPRVWRSHIRYLGDSGSWEDYLQMRATSSDVTVSKHTPTICTDYEDDPGCRNRKLQYSRTCVRMAEDGKYVLEQTSGGYPLFVCVKYVIRGKNVVQTWESKLQQEITEDICRDSNLIRNEWPWFATSDIEWRPCPMIGGYNFRINKRGKKRRVCNSVWRPSRLESECLMADGLQFLFPDKSCSIFKRRPRQHSLQCLASWEEEDTLFILASDSNHQQQYVLRMPTNYFEITEFKVQLYFAPVCPLSRLGIPGNGMLHVELRMSKSDSGVCYDDDTTYCKNEVVRKKKCTKGALPQFGNHCKRSCGLCDLAPTKTSECHFPAQFRGEWLLFESDRREEVTINEGRLHFSWLGTFVCKGKHWEQDYFKLLSYFENGCRPRYTCIHLSYREDDHILQYRLSSSYRHDDSFDMCIFHDDGEPLNNMIRSEAMKSLLPVSRTRVDDCGLGGLVQVNAMFGDGRSCRGSLSDWSPFTCSKSDQMTLTFTGCKDDQEATNQVYQCEAYVTMQNDNRLLITKQNQRDTAKYACWIIRANMHSTQGQPWRQAYILRRAQCGAPEDMDPTIYKPAHITFQIYSNNMRQQCLNIHKNATPQSSSTIWYTVKDPRTSYHTDNTSRHDNNAPLPVMEPETYNRLPSDGSQTVNKDRQSESSVVIINGDMCVMFVIFYTLVCCWMRTCQWLGV